jgi:HlyD family secretion protein
MTVVHPSTIEDAAVFRRLTLLALLAALIGLTVSVSPAPADDPSDRKPPPAPKPKTIKVETGPLVAAVVLKGTIEGEKGSELSVRPKAWTGNLQVKKAVEHGMPVKAGDILVEFDTDKIDQAIKDAKQERELAELTIRQTELELPILERQMPLELAAAERDAKNAADDFKKFLEIDKPMMLEAAEQSLKSTAFYLETAKDELKQLTKMYKDKDLTEETEEIVLKRYKHNVQQAEFSFKAAKNRFDQTTQIDVPRREIANKDAVLKAEIALAKAKQVNPLAFKQKTLALAKQKYEEAKARDRLADLEKDREALMVKAPVDGLVYHGRNVRGQWMLPMSAMGAALNAGGQVMMGEVFLTVVPVGKLVVRADAEEKDLQGLKTGLSGKATPNAMPDQKVAVAISKIASAPLNGKFEVRADLTDAPAGLVPGMTCSLRFVTSKKDSAVTVPAAAVQDDDDGEGKFVYLPGKDGKGEKKTVKVGLTVGDKVEILDGLKAGDEILSAKPAPAGGEK